MYVNEIKITNSLIARDSGRTPVYGSNTTATVYVLELVQALSLVDMSVGSVCWSLEAGSNSHIKIELYNII